MTAHRSRERSSLWRALCLAYAIVVQLALPAVASWADARAEAESLAARPTGHYEEHDTPQCPRVHGPDCALCRVIAIGSPPVRPVALDVAACPRAIVAPARLTGAPASAPRFARQARAPPLATRTA